MAINITKVINQIQTRLDDSTQTDRDLTALIKAANRLDNSGASVLTYRSTGQLPAYTDSSFYGTIAYVQSDNVFGDSDGRFYYASSRDSNWIALTLTQDSDEATITAGGGGAAAPNQIGGGTKGYNLGTTTQSFPFASSTSGTSIMTQPNWNNGISQYEGAASHSTTHAYYGGGYNNPPGSASNTIQKFPFASEDNYSDVGDLTVSRIHVAGVSSTTHGYAAGGWPSGGNVIDKYAFASDGDATDVGDLSSPRFQNTGVQSTTHGYSYSGPSSGHHIEKWSFASDGNSTSAGNKLYNAYYTGDNSQSPTHVYRIGGYISSDTNTIEKSATASDGDGTDVGDITVARRTLDNASSTDGYIYSTGGRNPSPTNIMERTSYTVDGNSVDVGDLAVAASQSGGAQV